MPDEWQSAVQVVQLLSGRWNLTVLAELVDCDRRYQDLHDSIEGIANRALTVTLRRAEPNRLVARHLDAQHIKTAMLYSRSWCWRAASTNRLLASTHSPIAANPAR